ncbi:MAG: hypothetical protein AB1665_02170 [Candidatus Thermoplasmatota archaeon]
MRRRPRSRIGTAPKAVARAFKRIAEDAAANPSHILPRCTSKCGSCPWRSTEDKMTYLASLMGRRNKLLWASKWGEPLVRGYASLLLLSKEEIPYIANACAGGRQVSYVLRGSAPKEVMIGMLNPEEPEVRLLAYRSSAGRKGVTVCSTGKGLYCIGKGEEFSPGVLGELLSETPYVCSSIPSGFRCAHKGGKGSSRLLVIDLQGTKIEICSRCISQEHSIPRFLKGRLAGRRAMQGLSCGTMLSLDCSSDCAPCPIEGFEPMLKPLAAQYLAGKVSDAKALSSVIEDRMRGIKKRIIILGEKCCGSDVECAVRELGCRDAEAKALRAALSEYHRPLLIESPSFGRVMAALWEERGLEALKALTTEERARIFMRETGHPAEILRKVVEEERAAQVLSRLPVYHVMGQCARFLDSVARVYKVRGAKAACEEIERHSKHEGATRALGFAMLKALGTETSKAWQYSKEEQELGTALASLASELLSAEGEKYDEALRSLLRLSGSGEVPTR